MIIALYGEKRVGKDTTADILQKYLPSFKRIAFADIPKKILSKTLNLSINEFNNLKNNNENYRNMLIKFAEEMKNYLGKNIWAKIALHNFDLNKDKILITDLRFIEEYIYIQKYNPIIIIKIKDKNIQETNIHSIPYNYIIDNTEKNLEKLEKNVKKILKSIDIHFKN